MRMLNLKDSALLRTQCCINGRWIAGAAGAVLTIKNPASGATVATVPRLGAAETREAIDAAATAFPPWAAKTAKERAQILRRWFDLIVANADDLATILTAEQGKPLNEARTEVMLGASYLEWFGEEA